MGPHHDTWRKLVSLRRSKRADLPAGDARLEPCSGCVYRIKILTLYALVTVIALGGLYVLFAGESPDSDCRTIAGCAARVDETCRVTSAGGAADIRVSADGCGGHCENGTAVEVVCVTLDPQDLPRPF